MNTFTTTDTVHNILVAHPVFQTACTAVTVVALISTNSTALSLVQPVNINELSVNSTEYIQGLEYNRNTNLSWDGISNMMSQILISFSKIDEIEALQDNWNGNGASAFSKEIILSAKELVRRLSEQPTILPTARDSIQMEYEKENGDYLEFELFENGRLKMFLYTHDKKSETKEIPITSANEVVCEFYGRKIGTE